MQVAEYVRADGASPYRTWFDGLDPHAAAKVATATLRLETGNTSGLKSLGGGLSECRIDWGPGYRVYLTMEGDALVILFGGGTKRRQQADIAPARTLLTEYRSRKAAAAKAQRGER